MQFPPKAFPVSFLVTLGNQLEWGNANSKRVGNEILHSTKSRKYQYENEKDCSLHQTQGSHSFPPTKFPDFYSIFSFFPDF